MLSLCLVMFTTCWWTCLWCMWIRSFRVASTAMGSCLWKCVGRQDEGRKPETCCFRRIYQHRPCKGVHLQFKIHRPSPASQGRPLNHSKSRTYLNAVCTRCWGHPDTTRPDMHRTYIKHFKYMRAYIPFIYVYTPLLSVWHLRNSVSDGHGRLEGWICRAEGTILVSGHHEVEMHGGAQLQYLDIQRL